MKLPWHGWPCQIAREFSVEGAHVDRHGWNRCGSFQCLPPNPLEPAPKWRRSTRIWDGDKGACISEFKWHPEGVMRRRRRTVCKVSPALCGATTVKGFQGAYWVSHGMDEE